MMMNPYQFISTKRNGKNHAINEIKEFVNSFLEQKITSSQMASWLMAVYFNGLNKKELIEYVNSIIYSGEQVDLSYLNGFIVDKHSTGGVGDKVSFIIGPILASCGCYVPMVVGRSLAHTGGTLDKLESIKGYSGDIDIHQFKKNIELNNISIIGQTNYICPADKYIYSIRDITGTIESLPLICASILSKKKAEGTQSLILDIKVGNGAFMKNLNDAQELGDSLKKLGKDLSIKTDYIISDMNQPLGKKAGLWCEIQESIDFLKNVYRDPNLNELIFKIGSIALKMKGEKKPALLIENAISSGKAYEVFEKMIQCHNGDLKRSTIDNKPLHNYIFNSPKKGYINKINTEKLGYMLVNIGGGRKTKKDLIDPSCGFEIYKKVGDRVEKNEPIIKVFSSKNNLKNICNTLQSAININNNLGKTLSTIYTKVL